MTGNKKIKPWTQCVHIRMWGRVRQVSKIQRLEVQVTEFVALAQILVSRGKNVFCLKMMNHQTTIKRTTEQSFKEEAHTIIK